MCVDCMSKLINVIDDALQAFQEGKENFPDQYAAQDSGNDRMEL